MRIKERVREEIGADSGGRIRVQCFPKHILKGIARFSFGLKE